MRGRELSLTGADNVRDLGGLPTRDGAATRFGVFLRSATLQELTAADVTTLLDLGLRLVVDLREPGEVEREGRGRLEQHDVGYVNLTVRSGDALPADVVPDVVDIDLAEHYLGYVQASAATLSEALRLLSLPANRPALFHCAAGKDRTGVLTALLLDAVGVPPEAIVADYAATAPNADAVFARLRRRPTYRYLDRLPAHVRTADGETMRRFLDGFHARYGGTARWLTDLGADPDIVPRLRAALVGGPG